jgi:hypothetical protein
VPLHKSRKSRPGTTADVAFQQLPIGQLCPILQKHRPAKVWHDHAHLTGCHIGQKRAEDPAYCFSREAACTINPAFPHCMLG